MLTRILAAALVVGATATCASATVFNFLLDVPQPQVQGGTTPLSSHATLSFEMLGSTLVGAGYSIQGYSGSYVTRNIGSWSTHVRGNQSYQGIAVNFNIDPVTPSWVCIPYPYCGAVDSNPVDGMPLAIDLNSISFKIVGDNNVRWPLSTPVTEQSLANWIAGQTAMRVAMDYAYVSSGQYRQYIGPFEQVISTRVTNGIDPVPLPASAFLLLTGIGGLGLLQRRRRA